MDIGEIASADPSKPGTEGATGDAKSKLTDDEKQPGWAWQNPKAREEYERSFVHVLDREFSLSKSRWECDYGKLTMCRGVW
jgi:hypothetical protein